MARISARLQLASSKPFELFDGLVLDGGRPTERRMLLEGCGDDFGEGEGDVTAMLGGSDGDACAVERDNEGAVWGVDVAGDGFGQGGV